MKPDDFETLKMVVEARSGVVIDITRPYGVESRLSPLARREGFASVDLLVAAMREKRDERLMWAATEALSPSDTTFFRDVAPFTQFRDEILPTLAAQRPGETLRVWSCAAASGQEVYSLAMVLDDLPQDLGGVTVELTGSDLSESCLEKAKAGLYTQFEVQRGLPVRLLMRHFERDGEMWRVRPDLRSAIRWRRINLLADLTALGRFDVIFCRYVVDRFEPALRRRILEKLARALPEDGYLVLGLTETAEGAEALTPAPGRPGLYRRNPAWRAAA